jgi:hypothetical protein
MSKLELLLSAVHFSSRSGSIRLSSECLKRYMDHSWDLVFSVSMDGGCCFQWGSSEWRSPSWSVCLWSYDQQSTITRNPIRGALPPFDPLSSDGGLRGDEVPLLKRLRMGVEGGLRPPSEEVEDGGWRGAKPPLSMSSHANWSKFSMCHINWWSYLDFVWIQWTFGLFWYDRDLWLPEWHMECQTCTISTHLYVSYFDGWNDRLYWSHARTWSEEDIPLQSPIPSVCSRYWNTDMDPSWSTNRNVLQSHHTNRVTLSPSFPWSVLRTSKLFTKVLTKLDQVPAKRAPGSFWQDSFIKSPGQLVSFC